MMDTQLGSTTVVSFHDNDHLTDYASTFARCDPSSVEAVAAVKLCLCDACSGYIAEVLVVSHVHHAEEQLGNGPTISAVDCSGDASWRLLSGVSGCCEICTRYPPAARHVSKAGQAGA